MKFFTLDLLERFGSEDDRVSSAAEQELERRSQEYVLKLRQIMPKLPARFRELLEQFYLHDARVIPSLSLSSHEVSCLTMPGPAGFSAPSRLSEPGERRWPLFSVGIQLDTPPKNLLVLQYRDVIIEHATSHKHPESDECPCLEWQYDEVDVVETEERTQFRHSILFTNGLELQLRFRDFDFATLKPIEEPRELTGAQR
jgi:hypothetical protein